MDDLDQEITNLFNSLDKMLDEMQKVGDYADIIHTTATHCTAYIQQIFC